MKSQITAVIITKNESDRIQACIKSILPITHDIIVVDSGSTDDTIILAEEIGATVIKSKWMGFGKTKNFGHSIAKSDWILSIDADEIISNTLADEINSLQLKKENIYAINRQNFYNGKRIKYSGWSPDWVLRLFNKHQAQWNDNLVHEKLSFPSNSKIIRLKNGINHYSYRTKEEHRSKIESYAKLRAQIWHNNKKSPGLLKMWFGPAFKAFKSYVLKFGFLDGPNGWTIAKMNAYLVRRQLYYYNKIKAEKQ